MQGKNPQNCDLSKLNTGAAADGGGNETYREVV